MKIWSFITVVMWGFMVVYPQQKDFYEVIPSFEKEMHEAAGLWMNKDYAKALDGFYSARELLTEHMPSPDDAYDWEGSRALKTYTILLTRMIEIDQSLSHNEVEFIEELVDQVIDWSEILIEQGKTWNRVETKEEYKIMLRQRWLKRFTLVIKQADKMSNEGLKMRSEK